MENILAWILTIVLYGIVAFFINAFEFEVMTMLNVNNSYMDWIIILITDVTAGVIFFGASARFIKRG